MPHIIIFGDSIAGGAWDEKGGWVGRLKKTLTKKVIDSDLKQDYWVYNLGISGDTTEWLLERFDDEIKRRLGEDNEIIVIFAIGINDSEFYQKTKDFKIPEQKFRVNLRELFKKAKKHTKKIVFVGLTPVDETRVDPIPWLPNYSYRNKFIKRYNEIIKEQCAQNKIIFIDLFNLLKLDFSKFLVDGVHPNSEGHFKIYELIKDLLEQKRIV